MEGPVLPTPFEGTYWVIPGKLLAGEYAGAPRPDKARTRLLSLLNAGPRLFLDLTEPGELPVYEDMLGELAQDLNFQVEYERHPIQDFNVPQPDEMTAILDRIDAALEANRPVYLHCWGGIGRTGTVVGCYLVRHGMSGEAALRRIQELRSHIKDGRASPETGEQRNLVLNWRE